MDINLSQRVSSCSDNQGKAPGKSPEEQLSGRFGNREIRSLEDRLLPLKCFNDGRDASASQHKEASENVCGDWSVELTTLHQRKACPCGGACSSPHDCDWMPGREKFNESLAAKETSAGSKSLSSCVGIRGAEVNKISYFYAEWGEIIADSG